jgi:hypothetical protein
MKKYVPAAIHHFRQRGETLTQPISGWTNPNSAAVTMIDAENTIIRDKFIA